MIISWLPDRSGSTTIYTLDRRLAEAATALAVSAALL
jgi:hypothetical protein